MTSTSQRMLSLRLVGAMDRPDFQPLVERIRELTSQADDDEPDVVLLLSSYPGEHSESRVEELRRRWPLARFVLVEGSWCDGQRRVAPPLPGVIHWSWHAAGALFAQQFAAALSGEAALAGAMGDWSLPVTMTDEERFLSRGELDVEVRRDGPARCRIAVVAEDACLGDWLIDALGAAGYIGERVPRGGEVGPAAKLVIYECDELDEAALARLESLAGPRPRLALVGFPRPQDALRCRAAVRMELLPKPVPPAQLERALARLLDGSA